MTTSPPSRRLRVAVVRGDALNPFELQMFAQLPDIDVLAVGQRNPSYEVGLIPVRTTLLPAPGDARPARLGRRLRLPVDQIVGGTGRLRGLEQAVAGADIIHAAETFIPVSEQAAEIAEDHGIPLVLTCWENIPFLYDDDPARSARKERLRRQAAAFVAITPMARDALCAEGVPPGKITVLPPGLDLDRFSAHDEPGFLRTLAGIGPDTRVVLYVGRLIREKGITDLVRAAARLPRAINRAPVHLVVIGTGPEGWRLHQAASATGLADRLHVLPGQSYADIPRIFRGADVVAVPSMSTPYWQEQFGFVLAEAMASGRPVVTTRSGSIPDVVGDGAIVVDDYDVDALAGALETLLTDPERAAALGRVARTRIEEHYDARHTAAALAEVYRRVLPQP